MNENRSRVVKPNGIANGSHDHRAAETAGEREESDRHSDVFETRRQRIDQYLIDSLSHSHTLTSIVGSVATDLMILQLQVGDALREAMGTGRVSPESLAVNQEGIDMYLKLCKQVTQISQLSRRLGQDAKVSESGVASEEIET